MTDGHLRRWCAAVFLVLVALAAGYLGMRVAKGLNFHTDLLALLPEDRGDPVLQQAHDVFTRALGRRVVFLVGHPDREQARTAATRMTAALLESKVVSAVDAVPAGDRLRRIGALMFPFRAGLLANADRRMLLAGHGEALAARALSRVFGFIGMADARLLHRDPFLLMPSFFAGLSIPSSRLIPDDGLLTVRDGGVTWILVSTRLNGAAFELDVQQRFIGSFERAVTMLAPEVQVLKLGAVFFARAGGQ